MPTAIRLPRLTAGMTSGAVVAWRKRAGEPVRAGEVVAEVEADKTTVDLESPSTGHLRDVLVPAGGEPVAVGTVLAWVVGPDEAAATPAPRETSPAARHDQPGAPTLPSGSVSPLARAMAVQAGLDPERLGSTAADGRVQMSDVLQALGMSPSRGPARDVPPVAAPRSNEAAGPYTLVPHGGVRRAVARRLSESKRTIPHFYLETSCRVDAVRLAREQIGGERPPSLNDFVLRAAALALRRVPAMNASWGDDGVRRFERVHLAFAVATEAGLVAPVLRDADRMGLVEIGDRARELAARARSASLRPDDLEGGTFTVSNLGMFGVERLYPILNPPQAGILGVGAAAPRVIPVEGVPTVATVMTCSLSADHRVVDGADAARFLQALRGFLERPMTMML